MVVGALRTVCGLGDTYTADLFCRFWRSKMTLGQSRRRHQCCVGSSSVPPQPTGGELVLEMPWKLDPDRLESDGIPLPHWSMSKPG